MRSYFREQEFFYFFYFFYISTYTKQVLLLLFLLLLRNWSQDAGTFSGALFTDEEQKKSGRILSDVVISTFATLTSQHSQSCFRDF